MLAHTNSYRCSWHGRVNFFFFFFARYRSAAEGRHFIKGIMTIRRRVRFLPPSIARSDHCQWLLLEKRKKNVFTGVAHSKWLDDGTVFDLVFTPCLRRRSFTRRWSQKYCWLVCEGSVLKQVKKVEFFTVWSLKIPEPCTLEVKHNQFHWL